MPRAQKAAIYCRVSTVHQVDKDSLPMQRQDMINYARYVLGIEDYEVFEDAGYSGKNTDRPAFQEMMERIGSGEFSHVLVWKIDRISRNLLDFATMYAKCKKLGVTFVSKNEQFDTSTAMGEAMLKIILVFAELERNMTSERVTATMISRAADKQWNGGRVPYGYHYDKASKTFSIREDEATVVRQIYELYAELKSLQYTANALNQKGLKTRRGYAWSAVTCHIILTSPFYLGIMRYNYRDESEKTFSFKDKSEWVLVPNHHPPLVTQEQFDYCQRWLAKNAKRHGRQHAQRVHTHIFAGLIHCGYCGSLMVASQGVPHADGYRPSIYVCGSKRQRKNCPNKFTYDSEVGNFVFRYISNMIYLKRIFKPSMSEQKIEHVLADGLQGLHVRDTASLSALRRLLLAQAGVHIYPDAQHDRQNKKPSKEKASLIAEIRKQERALQRLNELFLFADAPMSQKDYLLRKHQISDKIDACQEQLNHLQQDSIFTSTLSDEQLVFQASSLLLQQALRDRRIDVQQLSTDVGRPALKDFINSVVASIISKDGKVMEITFRNGMTHSFQYDA
jgi:DNA invertase Pin-like site-specific DNA recombinase